MEDGINAGRVPHNNASELIPPGEPEDGPDSSLPTKANDIYNFGILAWEVRTDPPYGVAFRSLETGSHGTTPVLRDGRDRSNIFDAKRG